MEKSANKRDSEVSSGITNTVCRSIGKSNHDWEVIELQY